MDQDERQAVVREIAIIDEDLCDGCGQCVPACAEGAIEIAGGKARLVAERLCDGLGACLGHCPRGAIRVEKRARAPFDEQAVAAHAAKPAPARPAAGRSGSSALRQWPVQLHLLPPAAPFFQGADLLVCATCVPVAMPDFHSRLLSGRAVVVACPKLDDQTGYEEKLAALFAHARPQSVTVARMFVPCCAGLLRLVERARRAAGSSLEIRDVVVGNDGAILKRHAVEEAPLGRARVRGDAPIPCLDARQGDERRK
ncbi:MAG: 4Fe-4S binding protein [Planctomycetes bacterium]|nr:4Fe-4S binding protein [Planctomycetota bacterium]